MNPLGWVRALLRRHPRTSPAVLAPLCVVVGLTAGVALGALTLR